MLISLISIASVAFNFHIHLLLLCLPPLIVKYLFASGISNLVSPDLFVPWLPVGIDLLLLEPCFLRSYGNMVEFLHLLGFFTFFLLCTHLVVFVIIGQVGMCAVSWREPLRLGHCV